MNRLSRIAAAGGAAFALIAPIAVQAQASSTTPSNHFKQNNLVSDGAVPANHVDLFLVNPWGIALSGGSPFWIANNHSGTSTLYTDGGKIDRLVVNIPLPVSGTVVGAGATSAAANGIVFNSAFATDFMVAGWPSFFIFSSEDGTISAWSPAVDSFQASLMVDNSASGTVYKGLALGTSATGVSWLYGTDFHGGKIDVWKRDFTPANFAFTDPNLPAGYAPFGIANIGGNLYVSYALQNDVKHDDVAGPGHGFVDVYDLFGNLNKNFGNNGRLISGGMLNSPWGMVIAPKNHHFGPFSGALLVGNFGDGHINAYNPKTGAFLGTLDDPTGTPLYLEGLWGLAVGNGKAGGDPDKVYFTAGLGQPVGSGMNLETHGLFGSLQHVP